MGRRRGKGKEGREANVNSSSYNYVEALQRYILHAHAS